MHLQLALLTNALLSYGSTELSLFDVEQLAFTHNKLDLPLAEINRKSALVEHEKSVSDFASATITSGMNEEVSRNQAALASPEETHRFGALLRPQCTGQYMLPTGGTLHATMDAPLSGTIRPEGVNGFLSSSLTLHQPLSAPMIQKNLLQKSYENSQPDIIAMNDLVQRQEFALAVAQSYFSYATLQSQIRRAEEQYATARSDVDIAKLKFREGELSQATVVTVEAALETAELERISLTAERASRRLDLEELLGITVDSSATFSGLPDTLFSLPDKDSVTAYVLLNSIELRRMTFDAQIAKQLSNKATLVDPNLDCSLNFNPQWTYMQHLSADNTWYGKAEFVFYLLSSREQKLNRQSAELEYNKTLISIDRETIRLKRMVIDLFKSIDDMQHRLAALHNSNDALEVAYTMAREQFLAGTISRIDLDTYFSQLETNRRSSEEATTTLVLAHLRLLQIQNRLLDFFRIATVP